jgi:hypothetical protein
MFFQAIIVGLVAFGINAILGSILFALLRNYIKDRITDWLYATISEYVQSQLELTLQNADKTAKVIAPLVVAIMKEVAKDFQKTQNENVVKIPLIGKVPAPLVQMFLERFLGSGKQNEGNNPFA